eukprot:521613_1
MFLFLTHFYRIYFVYCNSFFQYKSTLLVFLSIFIIIFTLFELLFFAKSGVKTHRMVTHSGFAFCHTVHASSVLLLVASFDTVISLLCLYLFIRPLILLTKQSDDKRTKQEMYAVVSKYIILSTVAVLTTFLIFTSNAIFKISGIFSIDICVNCLCIMHFNKKYIRSYSKLCCCPIWMFTILMQRKAETTKQNDTNTEQNE